MRTLVPAVVALALLVPRAADAGVYLGLRAGGAWPSGDLEEGARLSSAVDFAIPFTGEAGWQFGNGLLLAGYLRLAPVALDDRIEDFCDDVDAECGAVDLGVGLEAIFNLAPNQPFQQWVGVFGGWNVLGWEGEERGIEADLAFSGWELGAQAGLDFDLAPFTVGPYVQVGWGQFTDRTVDPEGAPELEDEIDDREWHMWTSVGLKLGVVFR
jgi:hypothetical protein